MSQNSCPLCEKTKIHAVDTGWKSTRVEIFMDQCSANNALKSNPSVKSTHAYSSWQSSSQVRQYVRHFTRTTVTTGDDAVSEWHIGCDLPQQLRCAQSLCCWCERLAQFVQSVNQSQASRTCFSTLEKQWHWRQPNALTHAHKDSME